MIKENNLFYHFSLTIFYERIIKMATIIHTVICVCDQLEFKVTTECRKESLLDGYMRFHSERCKSKTPFVKIVPIGLDNEKMIDFESLSVLKDFSEDNRIGFSVSEENDKGCYIIVRKELSSNDTKEIAIVALDSQRTIVDALKHESV